MRCLTKWLNKVVKDLLIFVPFGVSLHTAAQTITLDWAYQKARDQYPLTKQKDLVRQTADLSIQNLSRGYWPQVTVQGQASYQSDVTAVPVFLPGIKIEAPDKDQYKVYTDVSQVIYDGGIIKQQQVIQELNATVEEQKIEVELYKLKDRITQLYLGVMLLEEQIKLAELTRKDLQAGLRTVEAQVANELVLRSHLNIMKAEVLKADQRLVELRTARTGLIQVLGLFLNQELSEQIVFIAPADPRINNNQINRPELRLFKEQTNLWQQQKRLVDVKNRPRTAAFLQGGYGRPALNMLKNEFEPYYVAGLRMNWSLSGLYTNKKEKRLFDINQGIVDIQKDLFLLNTNTQLKQQAAEIEKWSRLVDMDREIISLRKSVKEAAQSQLENRVITANDYLREVNAEDAARLNLALHQLQLLQAQINFRNIQGD